MPAVNVAVLTRSEVLRMGVRTLLDRTPGVASVREFAYEPETAAAIDFSDVGVLLLSCPREEWARRTANRAGAEGSKVLLVLDEQMAASPDSLTGIAVHGILLKHALSADAFALTLREMSEGGFPMPAEFSRSLLRRSTDPSSGRRGHVAVLTSREQETLVLLVEGLSNKLIARRLKISEHGAKRLVANILAKMNCPNRTQAAAVAVRESLVPAQEPVASGQW